MDLSSAKKDLERVENEFRSVLGIGTEIVKLIPYSMDMRLVSFNAEPASLRVGEYGRALRVMTKSITDIAEAVKSEVASVTEVIRGWTRNMAAYTTNYRNVLYLLRTLEINAGAQEGMSGVKDLSDQLAAKNQDITKTFSQTVYMMEQALARIVRQLHIGRAIAVNLLVEMEVVMTQVDQRMQRELMAFGILSKHLRDTCTQIDAIVRSCQEKLGKVSAS